MTIAALLLALAASSARADCDSRPANAAEKQFHKAALAAFKKGAPPPPPGWKIEEEIGAEPLESVCKGLDHIPMKVDVTRRYVRAHDAEAREKKAVGKINAAADKNAKRQQDNSVRLAQIDKELEEVGAKMQKAGAAGRMDEIQKLGDQMAKLSDEKAKLSVDPSFEGETAAAVAEQEADATAEVEFSANEDGSIYVAEHKLMKVGGAERAYQGPAGDRGSAMEEIILALGPWTLEENALNPPQLEGKAHAKAHVISVRIKASPMRVQTLLKATDLSGARALLK